MPDPEEIAYHPLKSAVEFHRSPHQVKALMGPVGSGKSSVACWDFFLLCRQATVPMRGLVLRETYRQLADSTNKTFEYWFGPVCNYVKSEEKFELTIPGRDGVVRTHELHCRHARRVEEASNLLSTEYAWIWFEEPVPAFDAGTGIIGAGIPEGVFKIAMMRQRQPGAPRLHIILTFNPPNRFHWCHKTFVKPSKEELNHMGFAFFRQPPAENAQNLPPGYYERLRQWLSADLVQRYIDGEPITVYPGARVFPECQEHRHIAEELTPVPKISLITGHDFGLTPVALIAQVLPSRRIMILKEVMMFNAGARRHSQELRRVLKEEFQGWKWSRGWADPAGWSPSEADEKTAVEVWAANGYPLNKGAVTFMARKEAVKQWLTMTGDDGLPGILIDRNRCPILAEGMCGGYRYPQSSDGQLGAHPIKNDFSHPCDALQYMITGEFDIYDQKVTQADRERDYDRIIPRYNPLSVDRPPAIRHWLDR